MEYTPSTALVAAGSSVPARKQGRGVRALAAAGLALGLTATAAVPSYAVSPDSDASVFVVKHGAAQQYVASRADGVKADAVVASHSVEVVEVKQAPEPEPVAAAAVDTAAPAAAQSNAPTPPPVKVPVGSSSAALLAAARAQIGIRQDCTDMVQNALAAIGIGTRRDQGGYDMGVSDFARYGTPVSAADAQPGDIMIAPGYHVAIYAGNGVAVHGGYAGGNTMESSWADSKPGFYAIIVRLP